MRRKLFTSLVLIGLMCLPGMAHTTPIKFDVSGYMGYWNNSSKESLEKTINGRLVTYSDPSAIPDREGPEGVYKIYQIKKFRILTEDCIFHGKSGSIERSGWDDYLNLYGKGDWSCWKLGSESNQIGCNMSFGCTSWGTGISGINSDLFQSPYDGFNLSEVNFSITRSAAQAPVPEPATALLLLVGAPFMYRRSKRRG